MSDLIYIIPSALIAIIFHEMAHGYVSYLLGDPTPKAEGRLNFNPLNHLDVVGTLCLIFFRFGWAKPVKVNPYYYKNKKLGMLLVALAGPITNFILAFIALLVYGIILTKANNYNTDIANLKDFLSILASINIGLGMFNLIPFPPLDGSKVLGAILPDKLYFSYMRYEMYGMFVLFALLFTGFLDKPLEVLFDFFFNSLVKIVDLIV